MATQKKAIDRIAANLKRYQSILAAAKTRDVGESDTCVIVADMLADLLGYNKYAEVTTEFAIRGTYVDLAVKVDGQVRFLIEVKPVGAELKDAHVKQAIDYGANQGVEWIVLTNGAGWRIYRVHFRQPIDKSLVFDLDVLQASARRPQLIECFGNLSREGFTPSSMAAVFQQQQATSKYSLAAMLQSETIVSAVRREIRRAFPGLKVDEDQILAALQNEVVKRELIDSEEAKAATGTLKRALRAAERSKAKVETVATPSPASAVADPAPSAAG